MSKMVRRFLLDDERGSATIEFVIWIPLFMVIVGLVADASMLFNTHSRMFDVARDVSRQVAVSLVSEAEAERRGREAFGVGSQAVVDVRIVDGRVRTTISLPFSDAMLVGGQFTGSNRLVAGVTMLVESAGGEARGGGGEGPDAG